MAELVALGLAGNIVQFVDFGIKLFRDGRELYTSLQGNSAEQLELEIVTQDLKCLAQQLHSSDQPDALGTEDKIELRKLATECEKLANELLGILDELKVKDRHNRIWESFKKALRRMMEKKKIQHLEERLERFREQLGKRLVYLSRFAFR